MFSQPPDRKSPAFTLVEIIAVIIIISVIAALAITGYNKVMERQNCAKARLNLILVHSAVKTYYSKHNTFRTNPYYGNLTQLNSVLGLNIVDNQFTYTFWTTTIAFSAYADRSKTPSYRLWLIVTKTSNISGTNPGACP